MEDGDILGRFDGRAGSDGRRSSKGGVLLVEQENANEFFEVCLLNV